MPHPSNVSNFLCIPFLYQKYITSNCTWLAPCRSFNLLIFFQLWYTCPTSNAVPKFVHRQKNGKSGGSAGMDRGGLGERIRLAQNKYFCLLVWFGSSDLMTWLFAAKFQVSLCIGPKFPWSGLWAIKCWYRHFFFSFTTCKRQRWLLLQNGSTFIYLKLLFFLNVWNT